jgi:4-amino-4-deoxychorismate lyase
MSAESALRNRDGAGFELIETLRFEPDAGFVRLPRHLDRLARSAAALGFRFDRFAAEAALAAAVQPDRPQRVRLTLASAGDLACTASPFTPTPPGAVWRLAVAGERLASTDPLVAHKTTRRGLYERARAAVPADQAEEVLILNERGEVCEGTFTNVFLAPPGSAGLLTPAAACGLLPGVLRAELLAQRAAVEAVLRPEDLGKGALFVGNSLRGLVAACLA